MIPVDTAWENFNRHTYHHIEKQEKKPPVLLFPKCSDIYISTKTKIAYFNDHIDLNNVFWNIPVMLYQNQAEGVVKKQMKINCLHENEVHNLEKIIENIQKTDICVAINILKQVKNSRKIKFKDTRKITIGLSKKDLGSFRKKKRGAFYNCFVLILRVFFNDIFKEIHVKIFNTGKLEIPGIRDELLLIKTLNLLTNILQPFHHRQLQYKEDSIRTVLINSNFSCNYYIDRDKLAYILKYKYNINVIFDSCSYPGIQCKFYYNGENKQHNGICHCNTKCTKKGTGSGEGQCKEISFMIFRTGSVLIVGNCTERILYIIYNFLKKIFKNEYSEVSISPPPLKVPNKKKRLRKKKIFIKTESN